MESLQSDPNFEVIGKGELLLASELKHLCTEFQKEPPSKLKECAEILFKLGQVYLEKTKTSSEMLQKITAIRCSALLNGAKTRFSLRDNITEKTSAENLLEELGRCTLSAANAKISDDLVKISKGVFKKILKLRTKCRLALERVPLVRRGSGDAIKYSKVLYLERLQQEITQDYKAIMVEISEKVIELLGESPCKFAIAGLGSIARDEITPYSDYENVLVLEDGVEKGEDFESIKEYFRWFSVIFQLIIINFGETFIRSVGVKSLNDLYSDDPEKNWFYDYFTPVGIAFDGMAPTACLTPIGRQNTTEKRPNILELIRTSSEMAELVTSDEDMKNGYYVREIIARSCYIFGNIEVWETFDEKVRTLLETDLTYNDVESLLTKNTLKDVRSGGMHFNDDIVINVKTGMYRPLVIIISCHGRVHDIYQRSSFRIMDELFKRGLLSKEHWFEYKYTLAIVFEIRLKVYLKYENQRHKINAETIINFVGKQSYLDYVANMFLVRAEINFCIENSSSSLDDIRLENEGIDKLQMKFDQSGEYLEMGMFYEAIEKFPVSSFHPEYFFALCSKICLNAAEDMTGEKKERLLSVCIECANEVDVKDSSLALYLRSLCLVNKANAEALLRKPVALNETAKTFWSTCMHSDDIVISERFLKILAFQNGFFQKTYDNNEDAEIFNFLALVFRKESSKSLRKNIKMMISLSHLMLIFRAFDEASMVALSVRELLISCASKLAEEFVMEQLRDLIYIIQKIGSNIFVEFELSKLISITQSDDMWTALKKSKNTEKNEETKKVWCMLVLGKHDEARDFCLRSLKNYQPSSFTGIMFVTYLSNAHLFLSHAAETSGNLILAFEESLKAIEAFDNIGHDTLSWWCYSSYGLAALRYFNLSFRKELRKKSSRGSVSAKLPESSKNIIEITLENHCNELWELLDRTEDHDSMVNAFTKLWSNAINYVDICRKNLNSKQLFAHSMIPCLFQRGLNLRICGSPAEKVAVAFSACIGFLVVGGLKGVKEAINWIKPRIQIKTELLSLLRQSETTTWDQLLKKGASELSIKHSHNLILLRLILTYFDENIETTTMLYSTKKLLSDGNCYTELTQDEKLYKTAKDKIGFFLSKYFEIVRLSKSSMN